MISLSYFAAQYVTCRPLNRSYGARLRWTANALESFAKSESISDTLTEENANGFLAAQADKSPFTIRSYRSDILTLWNSAADCNLVPYPVMRRVRLPRIPELIVDCYTIDETRLLLAAANKLVGRYRWGVRKRDYWNAAIRLAWDSGLRRGDAIAFRRDSLRPDGVVLVLQSKTQKVVPAKLRATTVAALQLLPGTRPLRWCTDVTYFTRHFKRIIVNSGVNRGTFKWLRRASGSYVEMQLPGAGYKHLGQSGQQVFSKHYDAKLGSHNLPQPPEL